MKLWVKSKTKPSLMSTDSYTGMDNRQWTDIRQCRQTTCRRHDKTNKHTSDNVKQWQRHYKLQGPWRQRHSRWGRRQARQQWLWLRIWHLMLYYRGAMQARAVQVSYVFGTACTSWVVSDSIWLIASGSVSLTVLASIMIFSKKPSVSQLVPLE